MTTYKVDYCTLGRGREPKGEVGNVKQFDGVAYIQCTNTSKVEVLLEEYFNKPICGIYYSPVIRGIVALEGHCIIEKE